MRSDRPTAADGLVCAAIEARMHNRVIMICGRDIIKLTVDEIRRLLAPLIAPPRSPEVVMH
jgi:hypothetical protein